MGLTPNTSRHLECYHYRPSRAWDSAVKHHLIDCDLSALIFYSIGEVLNLPIRFVEVPNHNFIRWRFDETSYMNWDNNTARIYSDDDFRRGDSPTSGESFNQEEEENLHYLKDMTIAEISGYYKTIVAGILKNARHYKEAEQYYLEAISERPNGVFALNNLSWMYLTTPAFKNRVSYQKAYNLSKKVDQLHPRSIEYRDTFSCACAAVGRFKKAIKVEKTARNKDERIKAFKERKTCLDLGEQ
jgi:tetratricopeptide (TPR) repeat protein